MRETDYIQLAQKVKLTLILKFLKNSCLKLQLWALGFTRLQLDDDMVTSLDVSPHIEGAFVFVAKALQYLVL